MKLENKYLIIEGNDQRKIKDLATALTGEIETSIEKIIEDWYLNNELEFDDGTKFDTSEIVKVIKLALKNINVRKIDIEGH